jgi:hypothetical protein
MYFLHSAPIDSNYNHIIKHSQKYHKNQDQFFAATADQRYREILHQGGEVIAPCQNVITGKERYCSIISGL